MRLFAISSAIVILSAATAMAGDFGVSKSTLDSMGLVGMQQMSDEDGLTVRGKGPFDDMFGSMVPGAFSGPFGDIGSGGIGGTFGSTFGAGFGQFIGGAMSQVENTLALSLLLRRFRPEYVGTDPAGINATVTLTPKGGLKFKIRELS